MIFNVSGGGGTALNFRVVGGTTAPANPAENCIWVNTETPITSWIFSAEEPSPAEAGMVWFSVGTSSPVEFNALKKNGIQVYPLIAKQYVGGAWVRKTAKSYQGGKWVAWWNGIALEPNNQYADYTGGWVADARLTPWDSDNVTKTAPTVAISSSGLSIGITLPAGTNTSGVVGTGHQGCYRTSKKIDLTGYNTLTFDFSSISAPGGAVLVGCIDKLDVAISGNAAAYTPAASSNTAAQTVKSLDVSALNGEYYLAIALVSYQDRTEKTSANVKKVYLE